MEGDESNHPRFKKQRDRLKGKIILNERFKIAIKTTSSKRLMLDADVMRCYLLRLFRLDLLGLPFPLLRTGDKRVGVGAAISRGFHLR